MIDQVGHLLELNNRRPQDLDLDGTIFERHRWQESRLVALKMITLSILFIYLLKIELIIFFI